MEVCQNFSDGSCAFKGKRTKRSRLLFPVDTTGTTSSSTTGVGSDDDGDDFYNSTIQYSPTTSTTQISTTNTSEEDEDMANCLILLAQSGRRKVQVVTESKKDKISSRTFAETAISTTGKSGFYVYECKTCNRTFSSFQALGGHRASHKKPKSLLEEKKSVNNQEQGGLNKISLSLSNQIVKLKTKIHECSICGSNFSSGQALGGHMRRHRPPTTTTPATNTEILMNFERTSNVSESSSTHDDKSSRNILSLDLNLPAPPEDDHNFEQSLVFSATPLVDCYY